MSNASRLNWPLLLLRWAVSKTSFYFCGAVHFFCISMTDASGTSFAGIVQQFAANTAGIYPVALPALRQAFERCI